MLANSCGHDSLIEVAWVGVSLYPDAGWKDVHGAEQVFHERQARMLEAWLGGGPWRRAGLSEDR